MDCGKVVKNLQDEIDGRLPPSEAAEVRKHLESCGSCAAEAASFRRVGELVRLWSASRAGEKSLQLDALWTRVQAGIEEKRSRKNAAAWARKWLWLPSAAALAVLILLFYPSGVNKAPFHPSSFDVAVEELDSDTATVALVDRGEDLPRVIWILENDKT
jgi:anti-sigma factor RsiW